MIDSLSSVFDEGAQPILDPRDLLETQRSAFDSILNSIWSIAQSCGGSGDADITYKHPHYIFTINGRRGSGKTSLLLTVHQYLKHMGRGKHFLPKSAPSEYLDSKGFLDRHPAFLGTALVLPMIFPNEMEAAEETMEDIFAQINKILLQAMESKDVDRAKGELLSRRLHTEVSVGWSFARGQGLKTLERDSFDYKDFVKRRGEQTALSYTRMEIWRSFVSELLDQLGCALLAICIDDTDLAPAVSDNIIHSIRVYLSHPRIVTVLCVDIKELESQLFLRRLSTFSEVIKVIGDDRFKAEWMNSTHRELRHTLYKILPPDQRLNLRVAPEDIDKLLEVEPREANSDRKTNTAEGGGRSWEGLLERRIEFLLQEKPDEAAEWWLFRKHSRSILSALSLREAFHCMRSMRQEAHATPERLKRLAIGSPTLDLVQRILLGDNLDRPDLLLDSFSVNTIWDPTRGISLKLGDYLINSDDPAFTFLLWLIDSELVFRNWHTKRAERRIGKLMPPQGAPALPHLHRELMADSQGMAAFFSGGIVPRNCLYFSDLRFLVSDLLDDASDDRFNSDWTEILRSKEVGMQMRILNQEHGGRHSLEIQEVSEPAFTYFAGRWSGLDASRPEDGADLLFIMWLVKTLVQTQTPLKAGDLTQERNRLSQLFPAPPLKVSTENEQKRSEFEAFLGRGMRWLRVETLSVESCRRILRMAISVASEGTTSRLDLNPKGDRLDLFNLQEYLRSAQSKRVWALLAWAAIPPIRKLLELGFGQEEARQLESLRMSFTEVRSWLSSEESKIDLVDLPAEWRRCALTETDEIIRRLPRRPKLKESTIVNPTTGPDLDALGQIAALLGLTSARAKAFADNVHS